MFVTAQTTSRESSIFREAVGFYSTQEVPSLTILHHVIRRRTHVPREAADEGSPIYAQNAGTAGQPVLTMESRERRPMALPLACRVGEDADAMQIAEAIAAIWQEIDSALAPILGHQGVAALYKRSIYLAGKTHPWITADQADAGAGMNLAALKSALSSRSNVDASTAASALLHAFYGLLSSLVGSSLTERLLRSVWAHTLSGTPAQDPLP